jgi:hypothetical protein
VYSVVDQLCSDSFFQNKLKSLENDDITNKKYIQRTPIMAAGKTDHIWSLEELLAFPYYKNFNKLKGQYQIHTGPKFFFLSDMPQICCGEVH